MTPSASLPAGSGSVVHEDGVPTPENGGEDAAFDSVYPPAIRAVSRRFWTPVDVARRAANLFRQAGARRVLDVGSGAGKFVLVAAGAVPEASFVGVEQRAHLVDVARRAQERLRLPNASFVVGEATASSWRGFDGFYFFNTFAENLFDRDGRLDDAVELTESRFVRDVLRTERALREAPLGTAVVTYHGLSGRMPACYELKHSTRAGSDWLRLWVKTQECGEGFFLEWGDDVVRHRDDGALA
jgi:SAM-dependent methyltransferase